MKPILGKNLSLQMKLFMAIIVAIVTIVADGRLGTFTKIRAYMDTFVSPFYFLVNSPRQILDHLTWMLKTRTQLALENQVLRQELFLKNSEQLLLDHHREENARLRELLGSPLRQNKQKRLTQVISTSTDPYSDQIVIDKGLNDGVYVGQPVISDKGVVGQVIATSQFISRVLLICDASHALPIQILRNDIRMILAGKGCKETLQLEVLSDNIDIRVGDILVTSGLGDRFPEGYPVAVVSSIEMDNQRAYTIIQCKPTAALQRLHYLLLLWNNEEDRDKIPLSTDKIHWVVSRRLIR